MTKVSFLIPVFNVESYLGRCIDSILKIEGSGIEIIIVDDGSTDSSGQICDQYERLDSRVKVLHKANGGLVSARNMGLRMAHGEYIVFVDSDDWIDAQGYENIINRMEENPSVDIGIGLVMNHYADDKKCIVPPVSKIQEFTSIEATFQLLNSRIYEWGIHGKIYRRRLFDNIVFDEKIVVSEDLMLNWIVFQHARKVVYFPILLHHYFIRSNSLAHTFDLKKDTSVEVFAKIWESARFSNMGKNIVNVAERYVLVLMYHILDMFFVDSIKYERIIQEYRERICRLYDAFFNDLQKIYEENPLLSLLLRDDDLMKENMKKNIVSLSTVLCQVNHEFKNVYIYGTGVVARYMALLSQQENIKIFGFIVSDNQYKQETFFSINVYYISQILPLDKDSAIIIAMNGKNTMHIKNELQKKGCDNIFTIDVSTFIG